LHIHQFKYS